LIGVLDLGVEVALGAAGAGCASLASSQDEGSSDRQHAPTGL